MFTALQSSARSERYERLAVGRPSTASHSTRESHDRGTVDAWTRYIIPVSSALVRPTDPTIHKRDIEATTKNNQPLSESNLVLFTSSFV